MAVKQQDVHQPKILRAHRPKPSDKEETPLDLTVEPKFWRPDMKENTHRMSGVEQQSYYSGYQVRE